MAKEQLEIARKDLLDLSARNRLINTRRSSTRSSRLEIVDELADQVFKMLANGKSMSFLAKPKPPETNGQSIVVQKEDFDEIDYESISFAQPDEELEEGEIPARHRDDKLQTNLVSEKLQKKLLKLFYDARTFEEEQGVNTLYLAIGFLKWYEDENSEIQRQSPLILVPVYLQRRSVGTRFRIAWDEGDIATNLSLQAKLQHNFGIALPDIDTAAEDFSPSEYFARVTKAIDIKPNWEILPNSMVLWFFSFAKFLMYKDLEPERWPDGKKISDHSLISPLVGAGFQSDPPICGEEENIDQYLDPLDMVHVVPADSSQTLAIEEAKQGRNLVIQGPPGTGKSQTITNIIAAAVEKGKKVLFVSEKMAALQVVKQRLDDIQLGAICLELHSNKSNKRAVLQEIDRTLSLGKPKTDRIGLNAEELKSSRDRLNEHATQMHSQIAQSGKTTFQALGELVRLKSEGTRIASFQLDNPQKWEESAFNENRGRIKDLQIHLADVGNPAEHRWRGAMIGTLLPTDNQRIQTQIQHVAARIDQLQNANATVSATFEMPLAETFSDVAQLANMTQAALKAPKHTDLNSIHANAWEKRSVIEEAITSGMTAERLKEELESVVTSTALDSELATTRRNLKAYGKSWFRFFNAKYREAKATLAGIVKDDLPKSLDDQVALLDKIITYQEAKKTLNEASPVAQAAFGNQWMGLHSNWAELKQISQWRADSNQQTLPSGFFEKLSEISASELSQPLKTFKQELNASLGETKELLKSLSFDIKRGLGVDDTRSIKLSELSDRLDSWKGKGEELSRWAAFITRLKRLPKNGMTELAKKIYSGEVSAAEIVPLFEQAYNEALVRTAYKMFAPLASFSGKTHEATLEKFKRLDAERYQLARQQVAAAHYQSFPHTAAEIGEVGILKHEIKKKRRHMPIRKLLASAGHAVQAIKPVFMMSPISIAQFLEPGVLDFDLLLIDEASQVKPVDAFGAIARSKQMVVVGDERQLPPTNFFNNIVAEDDEDADPDLRKTTDIESILGLCSAQSMNERMLRWHYRSRHHSLIAVSNHEFYDDQLYIVPSPSEISESLGLSFVHIQDGVFDRGKSRTNRKEAQAVADAAVKHAENFPNMTLGVGAFSVAQRDAILDEVELRLLKRPDLQPFFATGKQEAFFVKNLENIQGDERDVIFISVGYGYDENGGDSMNFGPIGKDGGERRLNVLITRAKSRCVVFSSITSNYIDLKRTKAVGTAALKTYLQFAQTGEIKVAEETDRGFDSEFERQVAKALQSLGYEVRAQIGDAGFYVDLAIVDQEFPGRYLIGIECDGASYHSSRSARDRDQIRQAILEDRGWIIHRIWSTDWFQRPDEQLKKVCEAIEEAKVQWSVRDAQTESDRLAAQTKPEPDWELSREEQAINLPARTAIETVTYEEASFRRPSDQEIHELPPDQLGTVVESVVRIEGPIHRGELARRIAQLWAQNRAGRRIVECVDEAVEFIAGEKRVFVEGDFVSLPDQAVTIRNREFVINSNVRKPENIPPAEIKLALEQVIKTNIGILSEEAIKEVSRLLGFRSTSAKLKSFIQPLLESVCIEQQFKIKNDRIYDS